MRNALGSGNALLHVRPVLAFVVAMGVGIAAGPDGHADEPPTGGDASRLKTEHFDHDPGWEGHNNRVIPKEYLTVVQAFGYSQTHFAGVAAGEMGGQVWRASEPAYYGDKIGPRTLADRLSASGTFALTKTSPGSGLFFGFFRAQQPGAGGVIGKMSQNDRFRILTFNSSAQDFSGGFVQATPENLQATLARIKQIQAGGSTALFDGLDMAYQGLDAERTTGIILVTDGVCNEGPTLHEDFLKLVKRYDVRLFTIVIGNRANQPLMDRLAKECGGFAMNISEGDDIAGRLIQAKAKVLHECLHDVKLSFHGEKVKDLTPGRPGSLYMGQRGRFIPTIR